MVALSTLLAVGCSRPDATGPEVGSGTDFASGPASIAKTSGTDQNGEAGRPLPRPFEVIVLDDLGDGVPDVRVTWSVSSGEGELSRDTTFTDSGGHAESHLTLGPSTGKQSVRAAAAGGRSLSLTTHFVARATVLPIHIASFRYVAPDGSPRGVVEAGDTVEWTNTDTLPHTVSASRVPDGAAALESNTISPGETFRFVPRTEGRWEYRCRIHRDSAATGVLSAEASS